MKKGLSIVLSFLMVLFLIQGINVEAANGNKTHTYQVVIKNCTWDQAFQECKSLGGYLARIDDESEFYALTSMLENSKEYRNKVFYLGGGRAQNDTMYYWVDEDGYTMGTALNDKNSWAYTHWGPNEPSYTDRQYQEYYLSIFKYKGTWILNDEANAMYSTAPEYDGMMGYICEFESAGGQGSTSATNVLPAISEMEYSSGAGGWGCTLQIESDGSFHGRYSDTNYGGMPAGYSAECTLCEFNGQFSNIHQVNSYTYRMKIESMQKYMPAQNDPTIWYTYNEHPGLEQGDTVYLYLPGIQSANTDPKFQDWIWMPKGWSALPNSLYYYGLYDVTQDTSFISDYAEGC